MDALSWLIGQQIHVIAIRRFQAPQGLLGQMDQTDIQTEPDWHLKPHAKQWELIDCEADIAIYGGAAGGGKSFALLAEPICRGLHEVPGFYAVIFRRTSKQVTEAGALWDQASKIYPYVGGVAHVGSLEYRFPSGAKIAFRHIEHEQDKHNYAGSEICYLGFDELYHFTESQFLFLTSRNRSTCGVRPYIRATTNPDPGWLRTFLAPWIHDEWAGERFRAGEIKWYLRKKNPKTGKSEVYWVEPGTEYAKSIVFIPAKLEDNPTLSDDPNQDYLSSLMALPTVEQERLLYGNWNVREEGLVYPEFVDCLVEAEDRPGIPDIGGMDFGLRNPFVALWGYEDHDGVLWITECYYKRELTIPEHSKVLPDRIKWWCDPAGAQEIQQLRRAGHDVRPCAHHTARGAGGEIKNPKMAGISTVRNRMRTGRLKIVRPKCRELIRELGLYMRDPDKPETEEPTKENDHAPDAIRYLIVGHDRGREVPSLRPRMSGPELQELAAKEKQEAFEAAQARDAAAQANMMDDRWWDT